ncbi:Uncharacterised protein [Yersinia enterocolitica]|nr:Uncharacterised protein [Yersinia enterocolitica]
MSDTTLSENPEKTFMDNYSAEEIRSEVLHIIPKELNPDPRRSDCHLCKNATWFTSYEDTDNEQPNNLTLYCHLMNVVLLKTNKADNIIVGECDGHRIQEDEEE